MIIGVVSGETEGDGKGGCPPMELMLANSMLADIMLLYTMPSEASPTSRALRYEHEVLAWDHHRTMCIIISKIYIEWH